MTLIVGIEHEGLVTIGGDAAIAAGDDMQTVADPKVFAKGGFLFGFGYSFRMGQLLRWGFVPPAQKKSEFDHGYLVTTFTNALRTCFREAGWQGKDTRGIEESGEFLIGYRERLYIAHSDFQVTRIRCGYATLGAATNLALGALFATRRDRNARRRIRTVLEAGEEHSRSVRSPFTILTLDARGRAR